MESRAEETINAHKKQRRKKGHKQRYEFVGRIASEEIRNKYLHKSVASFYADGKSNPIKYPLNEKYKNSKR